MFCLLSKTKEEDSGYLEITLKGAGYNKDINKMMEEDDKVFAIYYSQAGNCFLCEQALKTWIVKEVEGISRAICHNQCTEMMRYKCITCNNTCLSETKPDNSFCGGCESPNWKLLKQQESYTTTGKSYIHPEGEV